MDGVGEARNGHTEVAAFTNGAFGHGGIVWDVWVEPASHWAWVRKHAAVCGVAG